jgi:hypothetical protein
MLTKKKKSRSLPLSSAHSLFQGLKIKLKTASIQLSKGSSLGIKVQTLEIKKIAMASCQLLVNQSSRGRVASEALSLLEPLQLP